MMKITRLVELSLFYKIQEHFKANKTGERLKSADFRIYNLKYSNVQVNSIINIYIDGIIQDSGYVVDYTNGTVRFTSVLNPTSVVTADYSYCYINLYDEGISPQSNDFKYPAIAIYEMDSSDYPYELGNSRKERVSDWMIEVWTDKGGENSDIKDSLMELFTEDLSIIDFNISFPTNRDGSKNDSYLSDRVIVGHAVVDSINSGKSGSLDIGDKPKYLNEISVELKINY